MSKRKVFFKYEGVKYESKNKFTDGDKMKFLAGLIIVLNLLVSGFILLLFAIC